MLPRALRNFGALTGAQVASRVLNFVLLATVARTLGSEGAGGYATAISVALIFQLMSDAGLSPHLIREASANPNHGVRLFRESLALKCWLAVPTLIAIAASTLLLPYPAEVRQLIGLAGIAALIQSFGQIQEALLRSREAMHWESLGGLLQSAITVALAALFLGSGYSLVWIGVARIVGALANFAFVGRFVRADYGLAKPRSMTASLRTALPYMATASMNLAYGQIDVLLLSLVLTQAQVGEYALISRIVLVAGAFASTGAAALLPTLARTFANEARSAFRRLAQGILAGAAAAGLVASAILAGLGGPVLLLAYGGEFEPLVALFQLATGYITLRFLAASMGMVLTAAGRQSTRAFCIFLGLIATVVLVLALAPARGVEGAILALVGSEALLVAFLGGFGLTAMLRSPEISKREAG